MKNGIRIINYFFCFFILCCTVSILFISPASITAAGKPDLTITQITWLPENPVVNDNLLFKVTIKNVGSAASSATNLKYNFQGESISPVSPIKALQPNSTEEYFTSSKFTKAGSYLFTVTLDPRDLVKESDETNNTKQVSITIGEAILPDLVISRIEWTPQQPAVGQQATVDIYVLNTGIAIAAPSKVGYTCTGAAPEKIVAPELAIQAEYKITRKVTPVKAMPYNIKAVADIDKEVKEMNEGNNELAQAVEVVSAIPPDLTVTELSWTPQSPTTADTVTFTAKIKNIGNGSSSASKALFRVGGGAGVTMNVPALSAGEEFLLTRSLKLSNPFSYVVEVTADSQNSIDETNENNNIKRSDLRVTAEL
jgi:subtilase family serine protease